ncbi:MAG: hypothetical protein K2Y22_13130 [Candidatus Obscuribacterales bacterium]|nr:hypothetical protein [Candidatus Obscuribacterales bacterium]
MKKYRLYHGNTLALTVALVGIAVVAVTIFILYYIQTLGAHKQAQNAIDAAALQAAKDIGEIYIDTNEGSHFGPVGVSDNLPPGNDTNKRPIVGINTLMATIRLDALIAEQLGSSTMLVLAREDYEKARSTSFKLQQKIIRACAGEVAKDRNGHEINIQANATKVYDDNPVKLGKGKRSGSLMIHPGILQPNKTYNSTGTPIPQPANLARLASGHKYSANGIDFYAAGVEIKDNFANDGGNDWSFKFVPLSQQSATLIESDLWQGISAADNLVPTLVKVEADQEINPIADTRSEEEKKENKTQKLRSSATALCAFYGALPSTDGALKVSFPQTKPPSGYNIDFTSVQSIMTSGGSGGKTNQIMLRKLAADPSFNSVHTAKDLGTASNYLGTAGGGKGWNDEDHGYWVTAIGGAFPDEPGSSIGEPKHFHSRTEDNPSVVLSFLVYDWLKCMYVKPNISEVVKALQTPLTGSSVATSMFSDGFPQPAYAEINTKLPVTFAIANVPSSGEGDPRNWNNYSKDPEGYRRQFANVFGYVPADITLPASSLVVSIDNNKVVTTNGQPPDTLTDLYNAVTSMNDYSAQTLLASEKVQQHCILEINRTEKFIVDNVDNKTGQPLNPSMIPTLQEAARQHESAVMIYGRALIVMQNAKFGLQMSYALLNDRKMLTSFGATRISDRTFELMPGYLYVPTRAATEMEISGTGKISTGQDTSAGVCDWAAAPSDDEKETLQFFVQAKNTKVSYNRESFQLLAPAFAASSIPPKDANIYSFALQADGKIHLVHQTEPTAGVNILEGQVGYQNTASLITNAGNNVKLKWNCVARDNVTNVNGDYFRNLAAPVNNVVPRFSDKPLVCEWSLRCPAPDCLDELGKPRVIQIIHGSPTGFATGSTFTMSNIKHTTDAAGNVRFTYEKGAVKEEMKFFDNQADWSDAWNKANYGNISGTTTNTLKQKGNVTTVAGLSSFYRAANGYMTGNFTAYLEDSTNKSNYFEAFARGMASLNVNDGYLKEVNSTLAEKGITSSEDIVLKSLVYSAWVFYTQDENGCVKLYSFAS